MWVNGREAGLWWSVHYECRIGAYLNKGRNKLKIEMGNLMANCIIGLGQRKMT